MHSANMREVIETGYETESMRISNFSAVDSSFDFHTNKAQDQCAPRDTAVPHMSKIESPHRSVFDTSL